MIKCLDNETFYKIDTIHLKLRKLQVLHRKIALEIRPKMSSGQINDILICIIYVSYKYN